MLINSGIAQVVFASGWSTKWNKDELIILDARVGQVREASARVSNCWLSSSLLSPVPSQND